MAVYSPSAIDQCAAAPAWLILIHISIIRGAPPALRLTTTCEYTYLALTLSPGGGTYLPAHILLPAHRLPGGVNGGIKSPAFMYPSSSHSNSIHHGMGSSTDQVVFRRDAPPSSCQSVYIFASTPLSHRGNIPPSPAHVALPRYILPPLFPLDFPGSVGVDVGVRGLYSPPGIQLMHPFPATMSAWLSHLQTFYLFFPSKTGDGASSIHSKVF